MKRFYLLPLLLFLCVVVFAQDCSSLDFTYTTAESMCKATGSITVNVTGGSGNYNYKVTGTIATPTTSSNVITGLPSGYYSVYVKDLGTGCIKQKDSIFVSGSYSDPRFQLTGTDPGCAGNDGTLSVINEQYGRSPFTYTIISPSPSAVGQTNTSGSFSGLTSGEYHVQLQDSCGGIQVRIITLGSYIWNFNAVTITRSGCDSADAVISLADNKGNVNTSGTAFGGFMYGIVLTPGDTTWFLKNSFRFYLGKNRSATVAVKDNCGNIHTYVWNLPSSLMPSGGSVNLSNFACSTITAYVTGLKNFTSPQYCLYNSSNTLISCNTTGSFPNTPYGSYSIKITDACYDTTIIRTFVASHGTPSVGATVSISNKNCSGFIATITGQANLTSPQYCLYDASNTQLSCNTTGVFNIAGYGSYCIETHDNCTDTIIRRCFTVTKPVPTLTAANVYGATCSTFSVSVSGSNLNSPQYCLYDSLGNVVACDSTGVFTGIGHGNYCIKAISCSDTTNSVCFSSSAPVPSGGTVQFSGITCTGFNAAITGQSNLTAADYCLYTSTDSLISCNTTGIFNNISYGSYCIKIHDHCTDTIISRCFTQTRAVPTVNATVQQINSACNSFSARITGNNLTSPQYCAYDSLNNLVSCNSTGQFDNLSYGHYCFTVHDGCIDTLITVCQTFNPVRGMTVTTTKTCTIGSSNVSVTFANSNAPYTVRMYHPDGTKILDTTSSVNPVSVIVPGIPVGIQYKIVGSDNCGNKDSVLAVPDATRVTTSSMVKLKCPSGTWLNGAGDISASSVSNNYSLTPQIISKNGSGFTNNYTSYSSGVYTFSDLEPAQYVVQYTMQTCNTRLYDTVTISPYTYPTQGQSAIYQCDNNGFSLGADVKGGVSPYTYQIIGSTPDTPGITTQPQTSPVFNINNGTTYSLVRLRSIDACGNATLNDVSVLPLQNISITANTTCYYQNVTLSVDTIPNATYQWYQKTSATDSVLVDSGLTHSLPFYVPEQSGTYICKAVVNAGCITRLSSFNLNGCTYTVMATGFELKGKHVAGSNHLYWHNSNQDNLASYKIERRSVQGGFAEIGELKINEQGDYQFNDQLPPDGINEYRLKLFYPSKTAYSNVIRLQPSAQSVLIYPNPVKDVLNITLSSDTPCNYRVEIFNTGGQILFSNAPRNITRATISYPKNRQVFSNGMYLVKVTNLTTGNIEMRKIFYQ